MIWTAFFFGGFDRAAFSLFLVDHDFLRAMGIEGSPERQGLLMTLLLLPYALSNIFLGHTADRWGPRKVFTLMTGFWAAAAIWMGAIGSYALMLVGRVGRGTAEGPLFPVANRYIRYWFPPSERGGANAIWTSGQRVGMAVAVPLLSLAIGMWGWRSALFLQAVFILILVVPAIWFLTADAPEAMARVGAGERDIIMKGRAAETAAGAGGGGDLSSLLRNYRFWLMVIYHFAVLATFSGLTTWLPKYLRDARGFDMNRMVLFASLPYLGSFLSSLVSGFLSDRIGRRAAALHAEPGGRRRLHRRRGAGAQSRRERPADGGGDDHVGNGHAGLLLDHAAHRARPHHGHGDRHRQRPGQFRIGPGAGGHRFSDRRHRFVPRGAPLPCRAGADRRRGGGRPGPAEVLIPSIYLTAKPASDTP